MGVEGEAAVGVAGDDAVRDEVAVVKVDRLLRFARQSITDLEGTGVIGWKETVEKLSHFPTFTSL